MKKKSLNVLMLGMLLVGITGCGETSSSSTPNDTSHTTSNTTTSESTTSTTTSDTTTDTTTSIKEKVIETVTITNKDDLMKKWMVGDAPRKIQIGLTPNDYTVEEALENEKLTITSDNTDVAIISNTNIIIAGAGEATITVSASETIKDSVKVTVNEKFEAVINWGTESGQRHALDDNRYLKGITVKSKTGEDLDYTLTDETDEKAVLTKQADGSYNFIPKTYTGSAHTLKITVKNPDNEEETYSDTKTFDVYRQVMYPGSDGGTRESTWTYNEKDQVIGMKNTGHFVNAFVMEPSKVYYAEMNFLNSYNNILGSFNNDTQGFYLGMAHYVKNDKRWGLEANGDGQLWIQSAIGRVQYGDKESPYAQVFNGGDGWAIDNENQRELRQNNFFNNMFTKNAEGNVTSYEFKYAVARIDDMFYAFVNDTLVGTYSSPKFKDLVSVPGPYMRGAGTEGRMVTMNKIQYYSGTEASDKVNELLNDGNIVNPYDSRSYNGAVNSNIRMDSANGFTVLSDNGSTNDAVASPYAIFGGDFTLNWTYKKNNATNTDVSDAYVRVRQGVDNSDYFDLGINYPKDGQASLFAKAAGWDRSNGTKLTLDDSEGINFKLTRKVVNGLDQYTLVATSVKNPSETQQVSINSTTSNGEVRLLFQNRRLSGTYTNISYSSLVD